MLKKIGAVLLAVGLFLPYTPGNRIVTGLFQDIPTILFQGVPVLITIAYVLHNFVPPLAQFHQRQGQGLHGLFRVVFFVLAGAYLAMSLAKEHAGWPAHLHVIVALVVTGGLLYWSQGGSEEHTSELQSPCNLVCRLLLEKKKKYNEKT